MSTSAEENTLAVLQKKKEMLFKRIQDLYDQAIKVRTDNKYSVGFVSGARTVGTIRSDFIACIDKINEISLSVKAKFTPTYSEVEAFELLYCEVNDVFHLIETRRQATTSSKSQPSSGDSHCHGSKLPPIHIPSFNGAPEEWPIFYQVFVKIVHENPAYSDVEKVTHLVSHLKGSARAVCTSIPPTAENYNLILQTLKNRFEDKRTLASTYLEKVLNFKSLSAESEKSLDEFLCNFVEPVNALKQMKFNDLADYLFLHIALKKLDPSTTRSFENNNRSNESIPAFSDLVTFVTEQAKILSRGATVSNKVSSGKTRSNFDKNTQNSHVLLAQEPNSPSVSHPASSKAGISPNGCPLCSSANNHSMYLCVKFRELNVDDRWNYSKSHNICFNCLSPLHRSQACKSTSSCKAEGCRKKHHTMLHRTYSQQSCNPQSSVSTTLHVSNTHNHNTQDTDPTLSFWSTNLLKNAAEPSTVLLATVTVLAKDCNGITHELHGLLDNGSQSHFLTKKTCHKLGLPIEPIRSVVKGIGSSPMNISACTVLNFHSRIDPSHNYVAHALVVDRLSDNVPSAEVSPAHLSHLKGLPLADVQFFKPKEVDLLIGAELWPTIVGTKKVFGTLGTPVALETTLGYVVMGRATLATRHQSSNSFCFFTQPSLDALVQKFWTLEDVPTRNHLSKVDEQCERFFTDTNVRNPDGTFTVRLPFCRSPDLLGSSKDACIAKFISLERRLCRNPNLRNSYVSLIEEYVQDGTISRIGRASDISDVGAYFTPHHGVHRPQHPTTPLRIVFNASSPTSSSYSLNNLLFVGPKLHADIFNVLIHFRLYKFVITADIKRMFLQINVAEEDRRFQRFIWRTHPCHPLDVYEINKVVFGNTSSPYLANRVVRLLAQLEQPRYPLAAAVSLRDVYVDDVISSVNDESDLIELHRQLTAMFASGGFTLSKWASNSFSLLSQIPEESRLIPLIDFDRDSSSKVLGVQWSPAKDCFTCVVDNIDLPCTKRNILSVTARIFDPLGLVAPVTILAKLIIKALWQNGSDWDETPSIEIIDRWNKFKDALPFLKRISFRRHVGVVQGTHTTLVGFADSSCKAYGACVYVRTVIQGVIPESNLLCAKSRVAPSTVVTIPRLELCAALLLSRLMRHVIESYGHRHTFDSIVAFTDSAVVLHWIHSDASKWKIFVGNRIAQIQENLGSNHWRHVSGDDNPADVLSRGISPSELINHSLWFHGPPWLSKDESHWPAPVIDNTTVVPELEVKTSLLVVKSSQNVLAPMLDRISTFRKLLRATSYVFRACKRTDLKPPFITTHEIRNATEFWIRYVQTDAYQDEITKLNKGQPIHSNIRHLDPFLQEGILRVGGRLQNSTLPFEQKHPILLPTKGRFIELMIDQYHIDCLHGGQQLVLSSLRQKYWIPAAISRIRSRIYRCNSCFRTRPKPTIPKMAPLPSFRVEGARVFERTGVDYAGPFLITPHRKRGQPLLTKSYICLFICLSVKAIHIELASDLTADCFMAAFKRFLSRRGPCSFLLSDGGTNFIGARRQLSELGVLINTPAFQTHIGNEMASRGIDWKINPACGPWFGGIWESNIKSIKGHLQRIIGSQILTYEEFNTVLIQVEAVMNSRPLCVLNNDPNSITALTPAHFLTVGASLDHLPVQDLRDVQSNRLSRYQLVDRIIQDYWDRWRREYLTTLQSRAKWTCNTTPIEEGTVVIVMKDNIPPLRWPLGIVERVYPGNDGAVRVVAVRTVFGTYRRPVGKVCPLPTQ